MCKQTESLLHSSICPDKVWSLLYFSDGCVDHISRKKKGSGAGFPFVRRMIKHPWQKIASKYARQIERGIAQQRVCQHIRWPSLNCSYRGSMGLVTTQDSLLMFQSGSLRIANNIDRHMCPERRRAYRAGYVIIRLSIRDFSKFKNLQLLVSICAESEEEIRIRNREVKAVWDLGETKKLAAKHLLVLTSRREW